MNPASSIVLVFLFFFLSWLKPKYFNGKPSQKFRINNDIISEVCIIFQERNKISANIYWFLAIYSGSLMSRVWFGSFVCGFLFFFLRNFVTTKLQETSVKFQWFFFRIFQITKLPMGDFNPKYQRFFFPCENLKCPWKPISAFLFVHLTRKWREVLF